MCVPHQQNDHKGPVSIITGGDRGPEPFQGFRQLILYGLFGEVEPAGNVGDGEIIFPAETEDFLHAGGEALDLGFDEFAQLFCFQHFSRHFIAEDHIEESVVLYFAGSIGIVGDDPVFDGREKVAADLAVIKSEDVVAATP